MKETSITPRFTPPVAYAYTRATRTPTPTTSESESDSRDLNTSGLLTCCYKSDDSNAEVLRKNSLQLYKNLDLKMGLFSKHVCGCWCLTPAMFIWFMNLVCAAVHLGMGLVVLREGQRNRENMGFQVVSVVGEWRNRSADGYLYSLEDAALGKIYLHEVCAAFAFMSFAFHIVIVIVTSVPPTCLFPGCLNCLADSYYGGIYRCCIWWRCATRFKPHHYVRCGHLASHQLARRSQLAGVRRLGADDDGGALPGGRH